MAKLDFHSPDWEVPLKRYRQRLINYMEEIASRKYVQLETRCPGLGGPLAVQDIKRFEELEDELRQVEEHMRTCPDYPGN